MRAWPIVVLAGCTAPFAGLVGNVVAQDLPLAPNRAAGQTVTPVFEGWYRNEDGSFSLSFGYYNRNTEEVLEIPIGKDNRIEPGGPDRGQPARFEARRHWGVFAVRVPADFGVDERVVWTLVVRGDTFAIPGSLRQGWQIDALRGEAGTGNTPPMLRFSLEGAGGAGPAGITAPAALTGTVGQPVTLTVWAEDDGKAANSVASDGRQDVPVSLTWLKYRGPGEVTFSDARPSVDPATGQSTTTARFSAPGAYTLRVRANDASGVTGAGHAQCCWTNGFVVVEISG